MTRIGTIASLPRQLRHKPDSRLANGRQASALIRWLNALLTLRSLLNSRFESRSIPKQNLSKRKTGSSLNLQRTQKPRNPVTHFIEFPAALHLAAGFQQIPNPLASLATAGKNTAKIADFLTEARKSSSPDPPKLTESNGIQLNPTESD